MRFWWGLLCCLYLAGCNGWGPVSSTEASAATNVTSQVSFAPPSPDPNASPAAAPTLSLEAQNEARLASATLAGVPSPAPPDSGPLTGAERDFVRAAAAAGAGEVQLGRVAVLQAHSAAVKAFARQMVDDHSLANDELRSFARRFSVALPPSEAPQLGRLAQLRGKPFDQTYARLMLTNHTQTVELFAKEARYGAEPSLRKWATTKLPALQHHLEMARELKV